MNRTDAWAWMTLPLLLACGESSVAGQGGSTSDASTTAGAGGSTTASSSASAASSTTGPGSSSGSGDTGGGAAASGGGGAGGTGGAPPAGPTPAECFAIHDQAECYAAGCDLFLLHPNVLTVVDDVCSADDSVGYCFREVEGGGNFAPAGYVRDFDADGANVLGLTQEYPLAGWTRCDETIAETVRECCCWALQHPVCEGITPIALEE